MEPTKTTTDTRERALEYIDCGQAGRSLPMNREGRRKGVSAATVWRWMRYGVVIRGSGERVYLRHVRIGARIVTTAEWLSEFVEKVAQADMAHFENRQPTAPAQPATKGRTPEARAAALAKANAIFG